MRFSCLAPALFLCFAPACTQEEPLAAAAKPRRVILVVADTLRADHLSTYGYPLPTAPELDRLVERGTLFQHAFSTAPWTLPSIASLMTSTWPRDHGAGLHGEERNLLHQVPSPLSTEGPATIAECLKLGAVQSAAIVTNPFFGFGLTRGFDQVDTSYGIDAIEVVARGVQQLERWGEEGGFLYLHFMDVHSPLAPDDADLEALNPQQALPKRPLNLVDILPHLSEAKTRAELRWVYDAAIRRIDRAMAQLFTHLEARGWLEDAIVVFTADHGEALWEHEKIERWHYDRGVASGIGHGQSLFQELVGVPLIVWAKELERGRCATPVSLVDIAPSLLQWLDCPVPPHYVTRGASLSDARRGVLAPRELVLEGIGLGRERHALVLTDGLKLISGDDRLDPRLAYDVFLDPQEEHPLPARPQLAEAFKRIAGPTPFERKGSHERAEDIASIESLRALGYLSDGSAGLPAQGFGDGGTVREWSTQDLRELNVHEVLAPFKTPSVALPQIDMLEGALATVVPLPGNLQAGGKTACVAVRARPRALLQQISDREYALRLPERGEARLGLRGTADVLTSAQIDETPFALAIAGSDRTLPQKYAFQSNAVAAPPQPLGLASGAHFFFDPLLQQLRLHWIAGPSDGDADRVTLHFRSTAPFEAVAPPTAPAPHPSWGLIAANAAGFELLGMLVDPPLEGEAAVLHGDRVWVAGAGPERSSWLYSFALEGVQLAPRERMRLPFDATTRVLRLDVTGEELVMETRSATTKRRFAIRLPRT